MSWRRVATLDALGEGPVVFKSRPKQIAVFKIDGRVFAVDNRCPHEGYPLAEGTVDDECVLTCNWHNWKFRLADGQCLLGGDHVRAYPVRIDDGNVFVNTEDPPGDVARARILDGLKTAYDERDFGRICREIARLDFSGLDPFAAVRRAVEWSHDRLEFGTTHAYAASADWLMLHDRFRDDREKRLICLAEAVDHMAFDALRKPEYPYAPAGEAFEVHAFLSAVEAEDCTAAEAMIRRGLADGLHWRDLEPALARAAVAHYNDFGHSLIYVFKTGQLIEAAGEELEPYLLPALARSLCYAMREDLIPEFREYAPALDELENAWKNRPHDGSAESAAERVASGSLAAPAPFPSLREAFAWLNDHAAGHSVPALYNALLEALARNLLHYDTSFQAAFNRPVSQNVSWLGFTHGVTFANAARDLCGRYPELWPQGLLQMACFLGRNRSFLDGELDEALWLVDNEPVFQAEIDEVLLDHGLRDPIFSSHLLKTTVAVREELQQASASCRKYLLAGLNRFLHSPLKQKHVRRLARQAISLVQRDFS